VNPELYEEELAALRAERNQWKEAAQTYESCRDNPFNCGHAVRFIWRDSDGPTTCAACRMFAAERLERERDELRERLAASEKLTAAYEQQERIACQVNVELTELLTATEKAATDFRARAEAELPDSWYADRELSERIKLLVELWRKLVAEHNQAFGMCQ